MSTEDSTPAAPANRRVIKGVLHRERKARVAFQEEAPGPLAKPSHQPPRLARMLALAHHIQREIDAGRLESRADVAARLGLSPARVTQLMDLTLLAPDIQEDILVAEVEPAQDPVTEHGLREIVRHAEWKAQRARWKGRP